VDWPKERVLRWGLERDVPYGLTHSCYQGSRPACGVCDTCQARLAAFRLAGADDPIRYITRG
jgi:7-cyano-7-deazaguanine synthase